MMTRGTKQFVDLFDRAQVFSATPGQNGWTRGFFESAPVRY